MAKEHCALLCYLQDIDAGPQPGPNVTLIPRGRARGLIWFMLGEDPGLISKKQLFARIVRGLGGREVE